jgi:hypothetical protein
MNDVTFAAFESPKPRADEVLELVLAAVEKLDIRTLFRRRSVVAWGGCPPTVARRLAICGDTFGARTRRATRSAAPTARCTSRGDGPALSAVTWF